MTEFYFKLSDNKRKHAEYDDINDIIEVYLGTFDHPELMVKILEHELIHACIVNADIDTTQEQDHFIMKKIWMI